MTSDRVGAAGDRTAPVRDDGETAAVDPPVPPHRIRYGSARIRDLDAFLGELAAISSETGAVVQAFDADLIVSEAHLREATRLAARAIARGEAVARDPGVEILLYAAGRRQIDRALRLGVAEGESRVVVLFADFGAVSGADRPSADVGAAVTAVEERTSFVPADDRGSARRFDGDRVREAFDIGDRELDAVDGDIADVVRERVALLDVEK
ncbi:KEOPS complex subunit Cgi121 [Halorubrum sp. BV1]|uniref:KEOPS complex subunit Cgi121 n=1 Tax=Halorubrum sp. BV1 TaxID=1498500 RepID=UPI000679CEC0|nr:KEOPS complex subunit Cgi121 [Halorubrum sp. BV1]